MTTFRDWFIFSGAAALLACNLSAGPGLSARFAVSPATIQPGERAVLRISLPLSALRSLGFADDPQSVRVNDFLLTQAQGLSLLATDRAIGSEELTIRYELTAHDAGTYAIPPVELSFAGHSLSTERMDLLVSSTREENDFRVRENFGEAELPLRLPEWLRHLLIVAALTAVLAPLLYKYLLPYLKRRRPRAPEPVPPPPPGPTPEEWLREALRAFRLRLESGEARPSLVDDLTRILREYYARKLDPRTIALTTRELAHHLAVDVRNKEILDIFDECDAFKFTRNALSPVNIATDCLARAERALECNS